MADESCGWVLRTREALCTIRSSLMCRLTSEESPGGCCATIRQSVTVADTQRPPTQEARSAGASLLSDKAYLLHFARRRVCFLKACELASSIEVYLAYRLWCLYVSQRVFLRVAAAETPGGVDAYGWECGRGRVGRRDDCGFGGRREGEVSRCCVRICGFCMHRCRSAAWAEAYGRRCHSVLAML